MVLTALACVSAPLGIGGAMLDLTIEMARHGAPTLACAVSIAGATAPRSGAKGVACCPGS